MKTLLVLSMISLLFGCVPLSYTENVPSGDGGKAMSRSGTSPPTSFAYMIEDGYYFVSVNEYRDSIDLIIRMSKKHSVEFVSGSAKVGKSDGALQVITFQPFEYHAPINPDCGSLKYIGCNNFHMYLTGYSLKMDSLPKVPKNIGQKLIIIPPEIIVNGTLVKPKRIEFINRKGYYLSPLNS